MESIPTLTVIKEQTVKNSVPRIIGLTGFGRSGKDLSYTMGLEEQGYIRLGFADALKDELCEIHGITLDDIANDKDTWRPKMVDHGGFRRTQNPRYWIDKVFSQIDPAKKYCITDVRYPNEVAEIQFFSGIVYQISRPGCGAANETEAETIAKIVAKYNPTKIINDMTPEILGYRLWHAVNSKLRRS